jgi:hypothetical protein
MRRYASLVIIVAAATVGLRAPLCAYACSETDSPTGVMSAHDSNEESAPCHGTGATVPEEPASNEHECDCDRLQLALTIGGAGKGLTPLDSAGPRLAVASSSTPSVSMASSRLGIRHPHLPPPDILLLKSTLLI